MLPSIKSCWYWIQVSYLRVNQFRLQTEKRALLADNIPCHIGCQIEVYVENNVSPLHTSRTFVWFLPISTSAMLQLSVTSSSFLQEVTAANKLFRSASVFVDTTTSKQKATCTFHPLTKQEIEALKQNHNTAENWNQILKLSDRTLRTDRIQCCSLYGFVVFGISLSVLTFISELFLREFWKHLRTDWHSALSMCML